MISNTFHRETTLDGEPLYLIRCPNEKFEGKRYGVRFYKGKGKTTNRWKALQFDEVFGYEVIIHESVEPFAKAEKKAGPFVVEIEDEEDLFLSDEELDEDEDF